MRSNCDAELTQCLSILAEQTEPDAAIGLDIRKIIFRCSNDFRDIECALDAFKEFERALVLKEPPRTVEACRAVALAAIGELLSDTPRPSDESPSPGGVQH